MLTACAAPSEPGSQPIMTAMLSSASSTPADQAAATAAAPGRVLKVAHRGGAGLAPENTLAAFEMGLAHGADMLELDVHLSKDGRLMVIHDPTLARTTNLSGAVADYTAAELAAADAAAKWFGAAPKSKQYVPVLDEVLTLAQGRAGLQVEVKVREDKQRYPDIEAKLVEILRDRGMLAESVVLSFDFPTLVEVKRIEPRLKTCALISTAYLQSVGRGGPDKVAEEVAALGVEYVGVNATWLTEALMAALKARNLQVGVWTVDDADQMRKFAAMGVAFITSNRPDILRAVLGP